MGEDSSSGVPRDRRATHARRWGWIAALAIVATAGCSLIKVAYQNADTVGLVWINTYLDFNDEQENFFKPRLRQALEWHRRTQLPEYAVFAGDLKRRTAIDITPAEVATIGQALRARAVALADHVLPELADTALQLTPDNLRKLEDKFEDNDDKFRSEMMKGDLERQHRARYEKTLDRAEEWYGRFSRDQRAAIRKLSDARPMDNDVLFAERQRRERELLDLLTRVVRERPTRESVIAMMRTYERRFDPSPDPQRRAFLESLRKSTEEMDAGIHNLSTPEQRAKAAAKLQDWIDTFNELSRKAT